MQTFILTTDPVINLSKELSDKFDQFQYIKIQPNTIDLSSRLWGINPTNFVVISQSVLLKSTVLH